ncbi:hypothetical protein CISIN_1g035236mg [Citrus sinensis]|uniref:Uncharacterized protein n=1 Tax=Citrus sinensis TaxID=2711 RepID=A0A067E0K5_CITSI|nr:hypothetical protein CISIN_1g035236mg [Citrus sinensis]
MPSQPHNYSTFIRAQKKIQAFIKEKNCKTLIIVPQLAQLPGLKHPKLQNVNQSFHTIEIYKKYKLLSFS